MGEGARAIRAFTPAACVAKSAKPQPGPFMHSLDRRRAAVPGQHCRDVQKPEPRQLCRQAISTCRSHHTLPQHPVSTPDPEDMAAAPPMGGKVDIPTLLPDEIELARHRPAPRQDDEI